MIVIIISTMIIYLSRRSHVRLNTVASSNNSPTTDDKSVLDFFTSFSFRSDVEEVETAAKQSTPVLPTLSIAPPPSVAIAAAASAPPPSVARPFVAPPAAPASRRPLPLTPEQRNITMMNMRRNLQNHECRLLNSTEIGYKFILNASEPEIPLEWPGYSPGSPPLPGLNEGETDFRTFYTSNKEKLVQFSRLHPHHDVLDKWKVETNNLNLVLNPEKFDSKYIESKEHLPIWMRAFRRRQPLLDVLNAVCQVKDIEKSIVYITIDGSQFMVVLDVILSIKCVKIRLYFHPYKYNMKQIVSPTPEQFLGKKTAKLTMHTMFGLYLIFIKLDYEYAITLEDDIKPLPDFYNYHLSLYEKTLEDSDQNPYYVVSAFAHGTQHHCKYVRPAIFKEGLLPIHEKGEINPELERCGFGDVENLVLERFNCVWGSGFPKKVYLRMFQVFKTYSIHKGTHFLGTMLRDLRKPNEVAIEPCSNRATRLRNNGENGRDNDDLRYWIISEGPATRYQLAKYSAGEDWTPSKRSYTYLNEDIIVWQ